MSIIQSSRAEDLEFDGEVLETLFEDSDCWLVALDDWDISVILSSLRYAHWRKRWREDKDLKGSLTWDEIEEKLTQLEYCLMAGCNVSELLDKFDDLNGYMLTLVGRFVSGENNITQAVENLELVANCAPDVNLSCSPDVIVNVGGGGETVGTQPPSEPGEEGGTPPDGWTEPSEVDNRKCKVANNIWDKLYFILDQLDKDGFENILSTLGVGVATSLVVAALSVASGPVGWSLIVVGTVGSIILVFLAQSVDLDNLKDTMTNNKEDLICALYNSTDAQMAKDDFIQVLTDGGANSGQIALFQVILAFDVVNALFFARDDANGQAFEAELDGYTVSVECYICAACPTFTVALGTIVSQNATSITVDSETVGNSEYVSVYIHRVPPAARCDEEMQITATANISSSRNDFWRIWDGAGNLTGQGNSSNMPVNVCGQVIDITPSNLTAFRAVITVGNLC
jgi:hypothetical protein